MTASKHSLKALLAGFATVALVGTAVAQSTPPTTSSPNPATGAGQQSTQNTPMGSTGTQAGGGAASGTTAGSGASSSGTSGSTGSSMGSGTTSGSMSDSGAATTSRPARADRN